MSINATVPREERNWGMLCHLTALAGLVIPFGNILGPLVVWLLRKDQFPFVNDQGIESLNFQITLTIALLISSVFLIMGIGFILIPLVAVYGIVMVIIAGMSADRGDNYRYPYTFRFIQ